MDVAVAAPAPDLDAVDAAVARAQAALLAAQRDDGHWCFELEADATIPSEYVLLVHYLGESADLELEAKIGRYLRRIQADHGGWPLFHDGAFDISATVKAYFALKMIGDDPAAPHMAKARAAIHAAGGLAATNVFTRIQLALYGELDWASIPTMPPELILLPGWFPIHLDKMSYWARTVLVPLLVLMAKRPLARNPRGVHVPELVPPPGSPPPPKKASHRKRSWAIGFGVLDRALKAAAPLWPAGLRARAIAACEAFVTERLNGEDGLGAIYPAMANSVMMYDVLGMPPADPRRALARRSVEKLLVVKEGEAYCQPCVSPVWDTALAAHALLEAGDPAAEVAAARGLDWLRPLQVNEVAGDWAGRRPATPPGGWAFQYANPQYPDLDDTAVVVMALDRAGRRTEAGRDAAAIARATEWVVGMQSKGGGWGAFDADNTYHYLNNIPFADHGALLDPPTADVSARCVSMLAQLARPGETLAAGVRYLESAQEPDGSWFGRWGVNYIYGTWSALCALNAAGVDPATPMVRRAVEWLAAIQNPDGGWGEDCDSYRLDYRGYASYPSIASQTAWALLGLMAAGAVDHPAVARGIAWLEAHQGEDGFWPEKHYTGGGFPRVFYLRYHGYPAYFPLWALARYRNLMRGNERKVAWGM
ncbi:MAG TPA: squalene--hopene cyclase [Hyphomicrobiales bacterium]|nr:squalene--hopene cyclase [Hyphomicrobiales bacterium]